MSNVETILHLAAEGGGLKIFGVKKKGDWLFRLATNDHTPTFLGDDAIHEEHGWVKSLPEALAQIRWQWNRFSPLAVHSEFAGEIFKIKLDQDELHGKSSYVTYDWERLCISGRIDPISSSGGLGTRGLA